MSFTMQKQSARNLVLSPNSQTSQGQYLGDGALTIRQRFNPSTVFEKVRSLRSDKMSAGKGTEFATNQQTTNWDTKGTFTTEADALSLAWMLAFLFGVETVTGAGPYTHSFTIPPINATMVPTTIYVEETTDQHFEYTDMCATKLSLTVPERGSCSAALDMVGTGRWKEYTLDPLPGLVPADYLLGSDVQIVISLPAITTNGTTTVGSPSITAVASLVGLNIGDEVTGAGIPANSVIEALAGTTVTINHNATAAATVAITYQTVKNFSGRQKSLSITVDRQAKPFQSSGDGLQAASVASGDSKFSVDFTIAANATDDVNGWFESGIPLSILIQTNPANDYGFSFTFPLAYAKASKLSNTEDKVMWGLSFDETCCLQNGDTPAIGATVITDQATFLVAA